MTPSKFAVTGGIGSGKSAVCNMLKKRGFPVFSCDRINRALLEDAEYLKGLAALFPACFRKGKAFLLTNINKLSTLLVGSLGASQEATSFSEVQNLAIQGDYYAK